MLSADHQYECNHDCTRATMPNGADVARWLGAELYETQIRLTGSIISSKHTYCSSSKSHTSACCVQIIGMSATMLNGVNVARWLGAELYETMFRPVKLRQCIF